MKLRRMVILFTFLLTLSRSVFGEVKDLSEDEYQRYLEAAKDLRCPTCTGLSVLESDAPFSRQIKTMVEEKVKEGASRQEIMNFFTERYGPWILREPPKEGVNLIAWIFPLALLTLGPVFVWFFVWRKRKNIESFGVRSADKILVDFYTAIAAERERAK